MLRAITLAWVVLLLGAGFTLVAEVALAEEMGAGAIGYGLLNAGWGGGAALGSFLAQRFLRQRYEARALIWGVALVGRVPRADRRRAVVAAGRGPHGRRRHR